MSLLQEGFTASRPRFQPQNLRRVLIANRGEIALRLIRGCKALGIETVAIYSEEDAGAPHVRAADTAAVLPGRESDAASPGGYLAKQGIVDVAKQHGAQAILPGYGFLSENAEMARLTEQAGLVWCGPTGQTIDDFGSKHAARELAERANVPIVPGSGLLKDVAAAKSEASRIGYPVMLKASSGGGGLGLQVCRDEAQLVKSFETVASRSQALYGDQKIFLEKYIDDGRHVEVQIFGNGQGAVVHFGERECSIQRRHQKVVEEAPSPFVEKTPGLRERMTAAAVNLGKVANYRSAGTVEFIVSDATAEFYYLESNCRLQVEHPVSEQVWDVDLVALMLQQADAQLGKEGALSAEYLQSLQPSAPSSKHAIEVRLYAEDPIRDFAPSPGLLFEVAWPDAKQHPGIRLDSWIKRGTNVSPSYDPLLSKIIATGSSREEATTALHSYLSEAKVMGAANNLTFLADVIAAPAFQRGHTLTSFLKNAFEFKPVALEILDGGLGTSVQDLGRRGFGYGVPESGAMDTLHMRLANAIVGNPLGTETLEATLIGPSIKFHSAAVVAVAGGVEISVDGKAQAPYSRFALPAGAVLKLGKVNEGCRAYLAIKGGLPGIPVWLASKSTSPGMALGGHQGRNLAAGDTIAISPSDGACSPFALPEKLWPCKTLGGTKTLFCMRGPYDSDEYVTEADVEKLYGEWTISAQAARSGIRLEGSRLDWARADGGDGGSHPSNVLEIPYPALGINWNGDTPVILGPDGPDLGGLLVTHTVISSEWRLGQLVPGDKIRFEAISHQQSRDIAQAQETFLKSVASGQLDALEPLAMEVTSQAAAPPAILLKTNPSGDRLGVTIRASGDRFVSIEIGDMKVDLSYRCQIELLDRAIGEKRKSIKGLGITNPNLRSLSLQFDPALISQEEVVALLKELDESLPSAREIKLPTRVFTMPLTFDDPSLVNATKRYEESVRSKAVYLPDNKEYLRKANGMSTIRDVEDVAVGTKLLAVGVGFFLSTPILVVSVCAPSPPPNFTLTQCHLCSRSTLGNGSCARSSTRRAPSLLVEHLASEDPAQRSTATTA